MSEKKARSLFSKKKGLDIDEYVETIDPNDPIEKLIVESVQKGEEAAYMRQHGIGPIKKIMELEGESERIWAEAKRLGKPHVRRENYENLANAFLKACVEDYEELISGAPSGHKKNFKLIEDVLEHQMFVKLDMTEQLKHIKNVYETQFKPYAEKHETEIIEQWEDFTQRRLDDRDIMAETKYRCPLCGGSLRPRYYRKMYVIGCTGCKLYA